MNRNEKITLYEGNVVTKTFRLKIPRSTQPWDVSLATQIQLEVERCADGTIIAPILANPAAPGANWSDGIVPIQIDQTVSDVIGTYEWSITVFIGADTITADDGTIEVLNRPGYPVP